MGRGHRPHQVEGGKVENDIWQMENLAGGAGGFREPSGDAFASRVAAIWAIARVGGVEVRGCRHWSALDNFEWMPGYGPTFGLIGADRKTFKRTAREGLAWLGEFAMQHLTVPADD